MGKFFEAIGYLASVLAAAVGIVYLANKLLERRLDEEIEAECDCAGDCDGECECDCDCDCECDGTEADGAVGATEA